VADRLQEIFKNDRAEFEKKWDDLKLFIEYGMLTEEKFYDKASKFVLFKNVDGKYFTLEEYEKLIKENQTDKHKKEIILYATDKDKQFTFIESAKEKGYDVLLMDGQFDTHFINHLEQKLSDKQFVRVDADVIDNLIQKEQKRESKLSEGQQNNLEPVFRSRLNDEANYAMSFEPMDEKENPVLITQSEFMRRMKDMAQVSGDMGFYGNMPDSYNLVVNTNHPLVLRVHSDLEAKKGEDVKVLQEKMDAIQANKDDINKVNKDKKEEEIPRVDKDRLEELDKKYSDLQQKKNEMLTDYGRENKLVKQIIDLALLSNNMLSGEQLNKFIKRSIDLI
jgi:molecular chaperone HtpG